jgi:hypothetical protein
MNINEFLNIFAPHILLSLALPEFYEIDPTATGDR